MKWEHKFENWFEEYAGRDLETEKRDIASKLDSISADGEWEVVSFTMIPNSKGTYYASIWKRLV